MAKEKEAKQQKEEILSVTENERKQPKEGIRNSKRKDSFGKMIFGNNELCAQFLREYTNIEQLKNVQSGDIEDISNRFTHIFTEEREADVIKKINIAEDEITFYLVSLIEHKSKVDYNVVMQVLRYMVYIWEDYEKRENGKTKGVSKTKQFKYPPILPIIYYDGITNWTASLNLRERIFLSEIFGKYIPDFECMLIPIHKYSNQEIMEGKDELAVLLLLDKLSDISDFKKLGKEIPTEYFAQITENTSQNVMDIMISVMRVLLSKLKLSEEEIDSFMEKIKEEDNVGGWFEHFQEIDLPAERRKMRQEVREEVREEVQKEVREEVQKEVREEVQKKAREMILDFLNDLGTVPEEIHKAVMSEEKDDVLKAMVKIAARATSFSDFQGKTADLKK